jgi:tRNA C32,U32 (ribose-2'-O)-methylase TrmJ
MEDVVAFSAVEGKNRAPAVELIPWADETLKHPRQTALLFGPEDTGLLQHHIEHARLSVAIPANSENRSFNLSNAVLLALYELQRGAKSLVGVNHELGADAKPSSAQQHQQLDKLVEELAVASGFYNLGTSAGLKSLMKNLTRRMQPTEREMNVLLGLFGTSVGSIRRTGR